MIKTKSLVVLLKAISLLVTRVQNLVVHLKKVIPLVTRVQNLVVHLRKVIKGIAMARKINITTKKQAVINHKNHVVVKKQLTIQLAKKIIQWKKKILNNLNLTTRKPHLLWLFFYKKMDFVNKNIVRYAEEHSQKETKLLSEIDRDTWTKVLNPRMLSGHIQGRFLSMISNMVNPKNILEIGTYTGYSALCLAEGLNFGGKLHTIDINEEHINIAKQYFKKSKYKKNIITHTGNALDIIPNLNLDFQLAFIDADKQNYCKYFDLLIDKMVKNSYIVADNVLWSGKVIQNDMDIETKSLDTYNKKVCNDKRLETVLLPIRDGLMISRKII